MKTSIGMDFGTSNSTMATIARDGSPKVLRDAEGEHKTPSVVYYGDDEVLVGAPAANLLVESDDPDLAARFVSNIKRELVNPPLALPDGRIMRPVDVAADIMRKLRHDAANGDGPPSRAVVSCPAAFDGVQRAKIQDAALAAGFKTVRLMDEPVLAAIAFAEWGRTIGDVILVYDLGGGTNDVAVVARPSSTEPYDVPLEAAGDAQCGGHDFDMALYRHWEAEAQRSLGRSIAPGGGIDPRFLRLSRRRKENLSKRRQATFSTRLGDGTIFESGIDRTTLEQLIRPWVDRTVKISVDMARTAREAGYPVDSVVLVGGSSRVPLVRRRLEEELRLDVHEWEHGDVAVAIGAALHAQRLWGANGNGNGRQPGTKAKPPATKPEPPATTADAPAPPPPTPMPARPSVPAPTPAPPAPTLPTRPPAPARRPSATPSAPGKPAVPRILWILLLLIILVIALG
jgi:molecular chaperone HscA